MSAQTIRHLDPKLLYRRLDSLLGTLETRRASKEVLKQFIEEAFQTFREDLRLRAGVLYREGRESFAIVKTVGTLPAPPLDTLDPDSPPLAQVLQHGVFLFDNASAATTPLGLQPTVAAAGFVVGRRPRRDVVLFFLDFGWVREELDFALNTVRAALGARIGDERVRGSFQEAAKIQAEPAARGAARLSRATRSPAAPSPPRRWAATSTTSCRSATSCWASRSATPAATACRRRCWCATS